MFGDAIAQVPAESLCSLTVDFYDLSLLSVASSALCFLRAGLFCDP